MNKKESHLMTVLHALQFFSRLVTYRFFGCRFVKTFFFLVGFYALLYRIRTMLNMLPFSPYQNYRCKHAFR